MKPHVCFAALAILMAAVPARAEETTARAVFASTAALEAVAEAACAVHPTLGTTDRRPVAVSVGNDACGSSPPSPRVSLTVRVVQGKERLVVVDATADDVSRADLQAPADTTAVRLNARLQFAAPRPNWEPRDWEPRETSPLVPWGIATLVVGSLVEVGGLSLGVYSLFKGASLMGGGCSSCEDHTGLAVSGGLLLGAVVMQLVGVGLIRAGKDKSTPSVQVSAGVSPGGGSLRLTF